MTTSGAAPQTSSPASLTRRLLPLYVAAALQNFGLWVPIEKLFMSEIGFNAATVGVMAAIYAAVVPILEVPSGILADRWSRRGVLMVANAALMLSALIGGLSHTVATYMLAAVVLGVFFAMNSGTMEAVVYDTVLEETGGSASFERRIGRVRIVESLALVTSALAGGWVAQLATPRLTYFLTVPFAALSVVVLLAFKEPRLHKTEKAESMRGHLAVTYRTITGRGRLLPIAALVVLTSVLLQAIFEFGPLWLVALAAPAILYGPFWAALTSTLGLGGLLAGRLRLDRPAGLAIVVVLLPLTGLVLTVTRNLAVITLAQVGLGLLVVAVSIHVTRLLHDAVPSTIRTGVASGVSALSWMVFLPFSLVFGLVSRVYGVHVAGWLLTGTALLAGLALVKAARRTPSAPEPVLDMTVPVAAPVRS
ncbi:MAG TPA: MFS transporter [Streptosporangiaceae bacterium]|jgi:MFS family permease